MARDLSNIFAKFLKDGKVEQAKPIQSNIAPSANVESGNPLLATNAGGGTDDGVGRPDELAVSEEAKYIVGEPMTIREFGEAMNEVADRQEKMESNPFLVPASQTLMTVDPAAGPDESIRTEFTTNASGEPIISSIEALAAYDPESDGLEAQATARKPELVKASILTKRMTLDSADEVRSLCDTIDETLAGFGDMLAGPNLIVLRSYVQTLMITLKSRPEFDSIIIAKDVHNVMKFIRAVRGEALTLRDVKEVKREVKKINASTPKAKAKTAQANAMANAFSQLLLNQTKP